MRPSLKRLAATEASERVAKWPAWKRNYRLTKYSPEPEQTKMTKHIHADLIHAWADGAEIEAHIRQAYAEEYVWVIKKVPRWSTVTEYRLKQETVTINGFEVPAPLKEYAGNRVYSEALESKSFCYPLEFSRENRIYRSRLHRGILHATKENAIASCKARLGIDPYK